MPPNNWILAGPEVIPPVGWILAREQTTGKDYWIDPKSLSPSAPQSELSDAQIIRIEEIATALSEQDHSSVEQWCDNMRRDADPESEIRVWEEIASVYLQEIAERPDAGPEERHLIYGVLVSASMLPGEQCVIGTILSVFPKAKALKDAARVVEWFRMVRFRL